jgi:hypothetical protein
MLGMKMVEDAKKNEYETWASSDGSVPIKKIGGSIAMSIWYILSCLVPLF